jgi:hypothetical protein
MMMMIVDNVEGQNCYEVVLVVVLFLFCLKFVGVEREKEKTKFRIVNCSLFWWKWKIATTKVAPLSHFLLKIIMILFHF